MKIEQIYTGCLAQGAYYICSNGEAAIIDPLREVQPYIDRAAKDHAVIKYVFETHFHADFVSGHLDLSKKTGAAIVYGPNANPEFEAIIAEDGQEFKVGALTIKVLHTPGHSLESSTYLLKDENGKDYCIFSGDTLFLGDVGRPDLAQKAANKTKEELAGMLYDSLMTKIMPLDDSVIVYPAHGAGSACGKNMMKETIDTLGNQKKINYALRQPDKASFIKEVTKGLLPPPIYFPFNVAMNKKGYDSLDTVMQRGLKALSPDEFEQMADAAGAVIIDTRPPADFALRHIPQSINIGIKGDFAPWVGSVIGDVKQAILIVAEPSMEEEVITRLARVGFDNVIGFLKGGIPAWVASGKETDTVNRISAEQFAQEFDKNNSVVIDVRKETEFSSAHVANAHNKPLAYIHEWIGSLNPKEPFYLHCAGGYRSMIAASILKARGFHNFSEVDGGYNAISKTEVPIQSITTVL